MSVKPKVSRRALLRGATIAAPTVFTLHSGAALAQSSNLISTSTWNGAEGNTYRCLDTSSVYMTDKPHQYDLGQPALGGVTRITADKTYKKIDGTAAEFGENSVTPQKMCADGGWYARKDAGGADGRWTRVYVRRGGLVSATALSSFAGRIQFTDV